MDLGNTTRLKSSKSSFQSTSKEEFTFDATNTLTTKSGDGKLAANYWSLPISRRGRCLKIENTTGKILLGCDLRALKPKQVSY